MVARFLSSANPNWPLADMQAAMNGHLDTTLAEAVARLTGDWNADVAAYDAVHQHILHMADALSDGIIAQFPAALAKAKYATIGEPASGGLAPALDLIGTRLFTPVHAFVSSGLRQ